MAGGKVGVIISFARFYLSSVHPSSRACLPVVRPPLSFLSLFVQLQRGIRTPTSILILISPDAFSSGVSTHLPSSRPLLRSADPRRGSIVASIIILVLCSRTELLFDAAKVCSVCILHGNVSVISTMSVCQWCSWVDNKLLSLAGSYCSRAICYYQPGVDTLF